MAEILSDSRIKPIAFYLPQYHTIPENDNTWGKGFTEWTNVKKAVPLFEGHYQPHIPIDDNYYNLLNDETRIWQSELAQQYGVFGFCYYHYWFKDGKRLLEQPAELMLSDQRVTIPFCFSWANENWARNWDGAHTDIIVEQDYGGEEEWRQHFDYLLPFFSDSRYITLDKKPMFIIYRPELIPNLEEMMDCWNQLAKVHSFKGICFVSQFPDWYYSPNTRKELFDYHIQFEPLFTRSGNRLGGVYSKLGPIYDLLETIRCGYGDKLVIALRKLNDRLRNGRKTGNGPIVIPYESFTKDMENGKNGTRLIPGAFCGWDNTPRKGRNGAVYFNNTPELFYKQLKAAIDRANSIDLPLLFINAWNEWGEGAHLEPELLYGYKFLEMVKRAVK